MADGVSEKAGQVARKLHMRGTAGYFVGLGIVGFVLMVLFFVLRPVAASVAGKVSAAGQKAASSLSGAVSGTSTGAGTDPRLEGL